MICLLERTKKHSNKQGKIYVYRCPCKRLKLNIRKRLSITLHIIIINTIQMETQKIDVEYIRYTYMESTRKRIIRTRTGLRAISFA